MEKWVIAVRKRREPNNIAEQSFPPAAAVMIKFETDEARKATMLEKFKAETAPAFFANMEKALAANGGQFFVGDEVK